MWCRGAQAWSEKRYSRDLALVPHGYKKLNNSQLLRNTWSQEKLDLGVIKRTKNFVMGITNSDTTWRCRSMKKEQR